MKILTPLTLPQLSKITEGLSTSVSDSSAAGRQEGAKFDRLMSDKTDGRVKAAPVSDRSGSRSALKDKAGLQSAEPSMKDSTAVSGSALNNEQGVTKPAETVIDEKLRASIMLLLSGIAGTPANVRSTVSSVAGAKTAPDGQIKGNEITASGRQIAANLLSGIGLRTDLANKKVFTAGRSQTILKESSLNPAKGIALNIFSKEQVSNMRDKRLPFQTSGNADKAGDRAALKPVQGKPDLNITPEIESSHIPDIKPLKLADDSLASVQDGNTGAEAAKDKQDNKVPANNNNQQIINREGVSFKVENSISAKGPAAGQSAERLASADSLSDNAITLTRKDQASLGISIEPEGLGKLDIQLSLDKGIINGQINVFDSANKDMLEKNLRHIMDALVKDGLNVGGFSVSLRERKGEMNSDNRQGGGESSHREVRTIEKSISNNIQAGNGRINIFI